MQDLYHALGRIESHIQGLQSSMNSIQKSAGRLDQRIAALESRYHFWRGGAGILLALSSLAGAVADKIFGFFLKVSAS